MGYFDGEMILENAVEPDASIEYLFVEKDDAGCYELEGDWGYLMGFLNLFLSGEFRNDDRVHLLGELENF
ncbi:MAG: hypothetical protein ACTSU5_14410 [Promethearchaeota archaeon]